ncbi:MAG: hypothetical protein ACD_10C00213G0001, partial [uncultured bacterium]
MHFSAGQKLQHRANQNQPGIVVDRSILCLLDRIGRLGLFPGWGDIDGVSQRRAWAAIVA